MSDLLVVALLCLTSDRGVQMSCQRYYVECMKVKTLERCVGDQGKPNSRASVEEPLNPFGPDGKDRVVGPAR